MIFILHSYFLDDYGDILLEKSQCSVYREWNWEENLALGSNILGFISRLTSVKTMDLNYDLKRKCVRLLNCQLFKGEYFLKNCFNFLF